MMIGTDRQPFIDMLGAGPQLEHVIPLYPGLPESLYTPIDKLPASAQELYNYDPVKARQMLADAGYPDGFATTVHVVATDVRKLDHAALLKDQWADIGVDLTINPVDANQQAAMKYEPLYSGVLFDRWETGAPLVALIRFCRTDEVLNYSGYSNPALDVKLDAFGNEIDPATRQAMAKALAVEILEEVPMMPIAPVPEAVYWWPWVQNYWGECYMQDRGYAQILYWYTWIDWDMKAEMGY
jgi:ABC-type transport system substrate-binding protein